MIGIINYGIGNLASVRNAFERLGHKVEYCNHPEEVRNFDRLVLPGVGSFFAAMNNLHSGGWVDAILIHVSKGKPFLGICLGMQLLFEQGSESGLTSGLSLIAGKVALLSPPSGFRVPHVGWNSLVDLADHPLLNGVRENIDVYFVHSYHCMPSDPINTIARCDFGDLFVAGVAFENIAGFQFHPEKSQPCGLRILENFAQWNI